MEAVLSRQPDSWPINNIHRRATHLRRATISRGSNNSMIHVNGHMPTWQGSPAVESWLVATSPSLSFFMPLQHCHQYGSTTTDLVQWA